MPVRAYLNVLRLCFNLKNIIFSIINRSFMNKRVLIIENDQDIRLIVDYILQEQGFETLSIPEPQELWDLLSFRAHVILLDEFVNSQPGHRLCRKMKNIPELAAIPVIILSTANDIELIAKECEANDYIRKPFDIELMVDKVLRVVNHQPLPSGTVDE